MTNRWKWGKLPEHRIKSLWLITIWKTIITNLNGLRTSAKDGSIQTNKTAKALKEIAGIDVFDKQTGQVKDMNDILGELGNKYKDLSKNQQLAIAEAIGGN